MPPKRKRGRPVGPDGKRVPLSKRTLISPESRKFLLACQRGLGVPFGRTIDHLIAYARSKHDFRLPLSNTLDHLKDLTSLMALNPENKQKETQ